jgi:hypothetical protein
MLLFFPAVSFFLFIGKFSLGIFTRSILVIPQISSHLAYREKVA